MLQRAFHLLCLGACLAALPALAQEGHPLTGTWSGDWGPAAADRMHLTVVMEWDGRSISGTINPGPNAVPLTNVALDVIAWTVRLQADAKDASGGSTPIAAEGRIDDLGSWHRRISGTWVQGGVTGDFRLTRQ